MSWSPCVSTSLYRSTSSPAAAVPSLVLPLIVTRLSCARLTAVAAVIVSPTSAAGLLVLAATDTPVCSTKLPPTVTTVITPAVTPAGTVRLSNCCPWPGVVVL